MKRTLKSSVLFLFILVIIFISFPSNKTVAVSTDQYLGQVQLGGDTIGIQIKTKVEIVGKYEINKQLVRIQSLRGICGYVYTSCGVNESTTDTLYSGISMIYENGKKLAENNRFDYNSNLIYSDIDIKRIVALRRKNNN